MELATLPAGSQGLMYMMTLAIETSPPWTTCTKPDCSAHVTTNNYVEGCWHLMRNSTESLPGQVCDFEA